MMQTVKKLLAPLQRRVRMMVGRGVISLVNDATKEQEMQVRLLAGELHNNVERYQEYGFSSVPFDGAECITVSVGGNRDHTVVIATGDRRHRKKDMMPGESALYDDQEQFIHIKRDGIIIQDAHQQTVTMGPDGITIDSPKTITLKSPAEIKLDSPVVTATGDLTATNMNASGDINAAGKVIDAKGNTANHSHP